MAGLRGLNRPVARGLLGLVVGVPALLAAEIAIAMRAPRIEGFESPRLDGAVGRPGDPLRVVWIGDSTGSGVGATQPEHALPRVIASRLDRPVELTVLAVSGARVADALREQLPLLAAHRPDWVFVGIGNNDVTHLTPRARVRVDLSKLLDGVRAASPERVVVLGIAEFAGTPLFWQPLRYLAGRRAHALDAVVREVARAKRAEFVPIREQTGDRFVDDPQQYHARDGFHPNDAGYELWADAVMRTLRRLPKHHAERTS